jgi:hypothetical protein
LTWKALTLLTGSTLGEDKVVQKITPLHENFLAYCSDDWTGPWQLARWIRLSDSDADDDKIQARTLEILRDLLEAGYIVAGDADFGSGKFTQWNLSVDQIIDRIHREWDVLGRDPSIWDIVWFVSTTEGDRALASGQVRNTPAE